MGLILIKFVSLRRKKLSNMIKMKYFALLLITLSLCFTSCEKEETPPATVDQTVLMYLPWATNLLDAFQTNIQDMESAIARNIIKNERVVVFLSTSPTEAELFELKYQKGTCVRVPLKKYSSPAFTTAAGITAILEDVKFFAPAHRYAMTIGCHGMGWIPVTKTEKARSVGQKFHWEYEGALMTRFFGGLTSNYQTEITTLAKGITDAGIKMEYILFDDCYMSSIEVAYDLREVADYLIGCPTEIMAYGMPYADIGPYLLGKVDYEGICNAFLSFYQNYTDMPCGTIGITVCSELDRMAAVMNKINAACTFDPAYRYSIQRMDGYTPILFFDYADYVAKLCMRTPELLPEFEEQLERVIPSIYRKHTDFFYSASAGKIKISTYSGITTSDPSINPLANPRMETAWYKATHQ